MFDSFEQILEYAVNKGIKKRLAVAAAEDEDVLKSVLEAYKKGIIEPILVGKTAEIKCIISSLGFNPESFNIIDKADKAAAARYVAEMISKGDADMPMKGLLQTSDFLKAVLDKELHLVEQGALISQATVCQYKRTGRMIIISDCAINIFPDLDKKKKIINNTIMLAKCLGCDLPRIAILAPLEMVNPDIPVTVEAAILSKMAERGQIKNAIIDGPLALDNAVSIEAAEHKGIKSEVAGRADILIAPDLLSGNILHKAITYFAGLPTAGTVLGAKCPIVMTSRTDTPEDKFNSILMAVMLAS